MKPTSKLLLTAGASYLIIFVTAVFANFVALESILSDPLMAVTQKSLIVRLGILAFLIASVFDIVVAWALKLLYEDDWLTSLSTWFRLLHGGIMAAGTCAIWMVLSSDDPEFILQGVDAFNKVWMIGLLFFGVHLILLSRIVPCPRWIRLFLAAAGAMYIADTVAQIVLEHYDKYADIFLAVVAVPSILGELSLAIWLIRSGMARHS